VLHRVGRRRSRSARLQASVQLFRLGLAFFGLALVSALAVVARIVFSPAASLAVGVIAFVIVVTAWVLGPLLFARDETSRSAVEPKHRR
jgi:hypothetical protein